MGGWLGGWSVGESGNKANSAQLSCSLSWGWAELGNIERKEGNDSLKLNLPVCVKNVIYIKECDWRKLSFWKWIDINIVPRVSIVIV